eukprot:scaffold24777_cov96-Isochrysis_galbana.AAC.2
MSHHDARPRRALVVSASPSCALGHGAASRPKRARAAAALNSSSRPMPSPMALPSQLCAAADECCNGGTLQHTIPRHTHPAPIGSPGAP